MYVFLVSLGIKETAKMKMSTSWSRKVEDAIFGIGDRGSDLEIQRLYNVSIQMSSSSAATMTDHHGGDDNDEHQVVLKTYQGLLHPCSSHLSHFQ